MPRSSSAVHRWAPEAGASEAEPTASTVDAGGGTNVASPARVGTDEPSEPADPRIGADEPSGPAEQIDDGADEEAPAVSGDAYPHPLDGWTRQKLENALTRDPASLGSMSIGSTNAGALLNPVQMTRDAAWELVDADRAWGTQETVSYLTHCLEKVRDRLAGAPLMFIGHISARRGGHLSPHVSHQAGRDVDLSYYYLPPNVHWYVTANAQNLDVPRTWAFVKALVTDTDVELILMDRAVQRIVRQYAVEHGEDRGWVDQLFDGTGALPPLLRHAKGHASHLHVRFYNPVAQETARRTYDLLLAHHLVPPAVIEVRHKVKLGETLSHLALRYGVSPKAIQQANGMKTTLLRQGQDYKVLRRVGVRPAMKPTVIPPRRLPPPVLPLGEHAPPKAQF